MGYIRHNAIVVTSWDKALLDASLAKAKELGLDATEPGKTHVNGYRSFLICPDGSKEGWPESDDGDRARDAFVKWLYAQRHEDNSSSIEWVEVSYGSDDASARVERSEWRKARAG
jgi:hypothetical protein